MIRFATAGFEPATLTESLTAPLRTYRFDPSQTLMSGSSPVETEIHEIP
jgi:hypothetical protein